MTFINVAEILSERPVKHLAHCLNRLFTDCLYLNIDSVTESFGGDLFVK